MKYEYQIDWLDGAGKLQSAFTFTLRSARLWIKAREGSACRVVVLLRLSDNLSLPIEPGARA